MIALMMLWKVKEVDVCDAVEGKGAKEVGKRRMVKKRKKRSKRAGEVIVSKICMWCPHDDK